VACLRRAADLLWLGFGALRTGSVRHEEWRFFRPYLEHDHVVVFEEPGES
jgi:hypothetical protein